MTMRRGTLALGGMVKSTFSVDLATSAPATWALYVTAVALPDSGVGLRTVTSTMSCVRCASAAPQLVRRAVTATWPVGVVASGPGPANAQKTARKAKKATTLTRTVLMKPG